MTSSPTPTPKAVDAPTLAACPFCGKTDTLKLIQNSDLWDEDDCGPFPHSDAFAVICDAEKPNGPGGCGAHGGFMPTEPEAIAAWNRRTPDSAGVAISADVEPPPMPEPTAFIWHSHLGERTKSLRWTLPTQWDYATQVERLVTADQLRARDAIWQERVRAALKGK